MTKNKGKLFNHFTVYLLGVLIIQSSRIVLIPIYTRYLETYEYGLLEFINRNLQIIKILFTAGFGAATMSYYCSGTEEGKNKVISTAMISMVAIGIVAFICYQYFIEDISVLFFDNNKYLGIFRRAGILIITDLMAIVPLTYIRANMKSTHFILFSIGNFLAIITINIIMVVILGYKVDGIILGLIISGVIYSIALSIYAISYVGLNYDWRIFKKLALFGAPFIPGSIMLFVINNGDRYFIQQMLGSSNLGLYSFGYALANLAMLLIIDPFMQIWGPYMFKIDQNSKDRREFGRIFLYVITAYCFVSLGISIFSKDIIMIIGTYKYYDAYNIVPLICFANIFWIMLLFFDSGFYIKKVTKYKPLIMGIGCIVAVVSYPVMIPLYGINGAAYATIITFFVFAVFTRVISNKIYAVPYPFIKSGKIIGIGLALYFAQLNFETDNILIALIVKVAVLSIYVLFIYALKIFEGEDIVRIRDNITAFWGKITARA